MDMPYILAHTSFAYTINQQMNCFSDRESLSLYMLGSLGPDMYFFDRIPPTPFVPDQKVLGNRLHAQPCDLVVKAMLEESSDKLFAFMLGFLTHIALDSTVHPYICARYEGFDHTRFEGDIDAVYYARFRDSVPFPELLRMPDSITDLNDLMHHLCLKVLGTSDPKAYQRSVRKMLRVFPVLFDPDGRRYRFVHSIEHAIGKDNALSSFLLAAPRTAFEDCMNAQHRVWYAKTFPDIPRSESVDELFHSAFLFAKSLISSALNRDADSLLRACQNRTMSDGPLPTEL